MSSEKVSVIIPVYNVEQYLARCLDSVINQTYQNLEIILVDDGSPDNSGAICDEYAKKDSRIRVIHQENGGVSAARNAAIAQSNGTYIVFVDSDDYLSLNYVQNMMVSSDDDYVASGCYVQNQDLQWVQWRNQEVTISIADIRKNPSTINYVPTGTVWAKRYKRSIILNANVYFDTSITRGEDTLFNTQYLVCCRSVTVIDKADYYYCFSPSAATTKFNPNLFKWSMESLQQIGSLIGVNTDTFHERVWNNANTVCDNLRETGTAHPFMLFSCIYEICHNPYVRKSFSLAKMQGHTKRVFLFQSYLYPFYAFQRSLLNKTRKQRQ